MKTLLSARIAVVSAIGGEGMTMSKGGAARLTRPCLHHIISCRSGDWEIPFSIVYFRFRKLLYAPDQERIKV